MGINSKTSEIKLHSVTVTWIEFSKNSSTVRFWPRSHDTETTFVIIWDWSPEVEMKVTSHSPRHCFHHTDLYINLWNYLSTTLWSLHRISLHVWSSCLCAFNFLLPLASFLWDLKINSTFWLPSFLVSLLHTLQGSQSVRFIHHLCITSLSLTLYRLYIALHSIFVY